MHKLCEALGIGEVDVGVRLNAVAVAARDKQHVPLFCQKPHFAILFPVPQAVQFHCMKELALLLKEFIHQEPVPLFPDEVESHMG